MNDARGTFLSRALGADWSLEAEHSAALEVAARLRSDRVGRLAVLVITATLAAWIMPVEYIVVWTLCILLNEVMELYIPRRSLEGGPFAPSELVSTLIHRLFGAAMWITGGVMWMLQGSAYDLLGFAILTGILIHISHLYNNSRLQTFVTAAPTIIGFGIVFASICLDPVTTLYHKTVLGFSVLAVLGYLVFASIQNLRIRERLRKLYNETRRLASEDPLTSLMNRRAFVDTVTQQLSTPRRSVLAFIDLDRFKPLNDEHGHAVGDEVLVEIGRRLSGRPGLLAAARLGGDEFAALFAGSADPDLAAHDMHHLHAMVTAPITTGAGPVSVGASVGWVEAGARAVSISEVLHAADVAMRRAKLERGGVVRFNPNIDNTALVSSAIEIAFRNALNAGKIRAALQPIVSVAGQEVVSMELLARWPGSGFPRDPEPQEFIPIAERLGLLNDVLWCTLHQALPQFMFNDLCVAINVSPSQLTSLDFLTKLSDVISSYGIKAERIELEVTEQIALRNLLDNSAVLQQARALGFRIVLDEFGAGNSSLAMLSRLPLDKIKLDRAFVAGLAAGEANQKVLRATALLAADLDITCAVAGVESAETARLVAELGCEQIQGYWVGRPELVSQGPDARSLAG